MGGQHFPMYKWLCFLTAFWGLGMTGIAQTYPTIRSGRPGQAIGPDVVGTKTLQFQQGIDRSALRQVGLKTDSWTLDNDVRFGLSELIELSALVDIQHERSQMQRMNETVAGLSAMEAGIRMHLTEQKGLLPSMGFQTRLRIPSPDRNYRAGALGASIILATHHDFCQSLGFNSNWILIWDGQSAEPVGKYVLNFAFPIADRFGGFVENYGTLQEGELSTYFDGGFAYLLSADLQLDAYGGYSENAGQKQFFTSIGASWRLHFIPEVGH
jgi:hypothetical protein